MRGSAFNLVLSLVACAWAQFLEFSTLSTDRHGAAESDQVSSGLRGARLQRVVPEYVFAEQNVQVPFAGGQLEIPGTGENAS
ncbi:hypothetical protein M5D96_006426 [Drosophila gunungcola]|uniref:Uncharacterized protein n=1 Tax=Drosophila gunungcola TaxID=103775 RepID=A0A9P9YPG2_9MUSC|nr:hypothetical protein M5D96_006426 [Drosophila gunungcola]